MFVLKSLFFLFRPYKLACAGEDQSMGFYDGPSFSLIKSSKVHNGFVNCNRFSPDGKYLITVSSDKVYIKYRVLFYSMV